MQMRFKMSTCPVAEEGSALLLEEWFSEELDVCKHAEHLTRMLMEDVD